MLAREKNDGVYGFGRHTHRRTETTSMLHILLALRLQLEELRHLVPEGTSNSKLQGLILSCKGDKARLGILVSDLWNSCRLRSFSRHV